MKKWEAMTFEDITGDGMLWAVRYEGDSDNILAMTFDKWNDHDWLKDFLWRIPVICQGISK